MKKLFMIFIVLLLPLVSLNAHTYEMGLRVESGGV